MIQAAVNSLLIATVASLVSTALGTMAGFAMHRYRLRAAADPGARPDRDPGDPDGRVAADLLRAAELHAGLLSVALAHIAFCIGFVAIVVRARLAGMDESLTEAARDCGATPAQAFRLVTLPLIMPGRHRRGADGVHAVDRRLRDHVLHRGRRHQTLPLQIYSMIKIAVTPEVNAVSTLLMLLTLVLIVVASRLCPRDAAFVLNRVAPLQGGQLDAPTPCCLRWLLRSACPRSRRRRAAPVQLEQLHRARDGQAVRGVCKCEVEQTYYSDNEELLAKLAAGAKGYDMVVPTGNAVSRR